MSQVKFLKCLSGGKLLEADIYNDEIKLKSFELSSSSNLPTEPYQLIHKKYVDDKIMDGITASNGVKEVGTDIQIDYDFSNTWNVDQTIQNVSYKSESIEKISGTGDFKILSNTPIYLESNGNTLEIKDDGTTVFSDGAPRITTSGYVPTDGKELVHLAYLKDQLATVAAPDVALDFTASGDIALGASVYVVSGNTVREAQANNLDTSWVIGIAEEAISDGDTGKITIIGRATIPSSQIEEGSFGSSDLGKPIYASKDNPGKLTTSCPMGQGNVVSEVGFASNTYELVVKPRLMKVNS